MTSQDADAIYITPIELAAADFSPYGAVLSVDDTEKLPIDFYDGKNSVHGPVRLDSDGTPEFLIFNVGHRGGEVRFLERHLEMTQTMIPINGDPYVMVVARPDAPEESGFPVLEEIQAFIVPGDVSLNLHRGTWHEPPFPLKSRQKFLITSNERLTKGLQTKLNDAGEVNELDVEKRSVFSRTGRRIQVKLP